MILAIALLIGFAEPKVLGNHLIMDSGDCQIVENIARDCKLNEGKTLDGLITELYGIILLADPGSSENLDPEPEIKKLQDQDDNFHERYILTICKT